MATSHPVCIGRVGVCPLAEADWERRHLVQNQPPSLLPDGLCGGHAKAWQPTAVMVEKTPLTTLQVNTQSTLLSCHKLCGEPCWGQGGGRGGDDVLFFSFFLCS